MTLGSPVIHARWAPPRDPADGVADAPRRHLQLAADRAAAAEGLKANPNSRIPPRENRAFLRRAVHYLAREAGITQFLDIGTGIPTSPNVHEVAQDAEPTARVVYVDNLKISSPCEICQGTD